MIARNLGRRLPDIAGLLTASPVFYIGLLIGVIMPTVSALVYPTYTHKVPGEIAEWSRLQELPFVLSEFFVICWAAVRGMELQTYWGKIPRDCRIAFAIFMVGLWGSTLFVSKVPITSLTISLSFVLHLLFAISIHHLSSFSRNAGGNQLVSGLGWGLVILAALTAWRFLLPPADYLVPGGKIEWHASLPGFISVRHFGSWSGAIAAIFAAIIMQRRDEKAFTWHDLFFLLSISMTIWSGTRAAVFAIAVSCTFLLVATRTVPKLSVVGRLSMLTGIAACIAFLLIPYGDPNFYLVSMSDGYGTPDQFSSGRTEMWIATYHKWLQAPWFGWGSGSTFWEVRALGWTHTQPHNFVLQFLVSWGIIGAAGAFWLLGRAVIEAQRCALDQPKVWPLLTGLYALLIMACLEGMLHYPRFIMLIMVLFAAIFRLSQREPETDLISRRSPRPKSSSLFHSPRQSRQQRSAFLASRLRWHKC